MKSAPIALFIYNRPGHACRTLAALGANMGADGHDLFVYSDAAANSLFTDAVDETRRAVSNHPDLDKFRSFNLIFRAHNYGLARSITEGVTELCSKYGSVIVVEDDIITSPWFLDFMRQALIRFSCDTKVASISGYFFQIPQSDHFGNCSFLNLTSSWGWGTWQRAWQHYNPDAKSLLGQLSKSKSRLRFDLDGAYPYFNMLKRCAQGRNQSWAIRWYATAFLRGMLTLYPKKSLIVNRGFDGTGVHCSSFNSHFSTELFDGKVEIPESMDVQENRMVRQLMAHSMKRSWRQKALDLFKSFFVKIGWL